MFLTLRYWVSRTSVDHLHRTQFQSGVDYLSITGVTEVQVYHHHHHHHHIGDG